MRGHVFANPERSYFFPVRSGPVLPVWNGHFLPIRRGANPEGSCFLPIRRGPVFANLEGSESGGVLFCFQSGRVIFFPIPRSRNSKKYCFFCKSRIHFFANSEGSYFATPEGSCFANSEKSLKADPEESEKLLKSEPCAEVRDLESLYRRDKGNQ